MTVMERHDPVVWRSRPFRPVLPDGAVHVWRFDLDVIAANTEILSDDERLRAERFQRDRDRRRFVAGRTALRSLAAAYLETTAASIEFEYSKTGRPQVRGAHFDVNLAHSEHIALCATSRAPVGIDVERVKAFDHLAAVARRSFAASECQQLDAAESPARRLDVFYRTWTRREAVIKGLGHGLPDALDGGPISELEAYVASRTDQPWSILVFDPMPGFFGALAVSNHNPTVYAFDYSEETSPQTGRTS
jgi:4'-phosphopantetheinyl transferase